MKTTIPNDSKMKELILHVAKASANDLKFGAVKLNKILFFADFLSYFRRGKSITGQEYFALDEGPAPRRMLPIVNRMIDAREVAWQSIDIGLPHPKKRLVALRPPDYDKLDKEDLIIINEVIEKLWDKNGMEATKLSHEFAGWLAAYSKGEKTTISYSTVRLNLSGFEFLGIENFCLPQKLIEYGKQLAQKLEAAHATAGA